MQSQDLLNLKEVAKNIPLQNQAEFTVKPTGEVSVKGSPDPELIRQLLASADYQQDQNRRYKSEIERQAKQVDLMVLGFLGTTFLVAVLCLFLSFNQRQHSQRNNNGELLRGTYCQ